MERCAGSFQEDTDHSIALFQDGRILGGFVICHYLGASATVHMSGANEHWCSRDMLWMLFHYAFRQLGLRKLLGPVASNNYHALSIDLRGGWHIEALVRDAYPDAHLFILSMDRETCPWLRLKPREWQPGPTAREAA